MKKYILILMSAILLVGCNQEGQENKSDLATKGNCKATDCIKQIDITSTVEEINQIIGFKGKLIDEKYNKYYWELSENSGIEVTYYSNDKGTIEVDIGKNVLANNSVDFSRYDELQPKIKEGITYDEFKNYVGNVEGTLIEKSNITNKYIWVSEDGSYLNASFSNRSGKCTLATGNIK